MKQHTISDVEAVLSKNGYSYKLMGKSIMAVCPKHNSSGDGDRNGQISITKNDRAYCFCYSHCGGYFLDEVFEEMRMPEWVEGSGKLHLQHQEPEIAQPIDYRSDNLFGFWSSLEKLTDQPVFKGIDNDELNDLGFRWVENDGRYGLGTGVLIPYWGGDFDETKANSTSSLYFAQTRHLSGNRRFSFAKDYKPTVYGKWVLSTLLLDPVGDRLPVVITEGVHDAIVLNHCIVPAIALPSSSSRELCQEVVKWLHANQLPIIYGGDNDEAGDKLRKVIDEAKVNYIIKQPPTSCKDYGEFFEQAGAGAVIDYFDQILSPVIQPSQTVIEPSNPEPIAPTTMQANFSEAVMNVMSIFGGGELVYHKD